MSFTKSYLVVYNICQSLGWSLVLYQTVRALLITRSASDVYAAAGLPTREHAAQIPACHTVDMQENGHRQGHSKFMISTNVESRSV